MQILDGKKIANDVKREIADEVAKLKLQHKKIPHLAAILVGNNGASETYVNAKVKACEKVGFRSTLIRLKEDVSEEKLIKNIINLNNNIEIDGFIVQLPLPDHIDEMKIKNAIKPSKDVDGFHPINVGKMALNLPTYLPATPAGILELITRYNIETSGKNCVVVGRSQIVGSPISILLSQNNKYANATVTLTHSRTKNLHELTKRADILIVALGKAGFVKAEMVKKGACVIDVGITRVKSNKTKNGWKLLGDVDYENVKRKASYITPVPGGVGPMTIAMLLKNTLISSSKFIS